MHALGRAYQPRVRVFEPDKKVTTGKRDDDVPLAVRRSGDSHRARSRGARLPHATLPHPRRDATRRIDPRHLHVRPLREARVGLE